LLLTSALKTPETTVAFQQYILEVASGASPHRYGALRLAFGNTIDAIKQERQKIEDERKAREEATRSEELMSRPTLECRTTGKMGRREIGRRGRAQTIPGCGEVSIQGVVNKCTCGRSLVCSKCGQTWDGGNACWGCSQAFR